MADRYTVSVDYEDDGCVGRYRILAKHDDLVVVDERDGGEPEDQSLVRDWGWVRRALLNAYRLGVKDGESNGRP